MPVHSNKRLQYSVIRLLNPMFNGSQGIKKQYNFIEQWTKEVSNEC